MMGMLKDLTVNRDGTQNITVTVTSDFSEAFDELNEVSTVYRNAIREIGGVSTMVGMRDDAIPTFRESWEKGHLGRQIEIVPGSSKPGWSNVRIYFGSSEFDTQQMSRLIDSLIQDAEALGIPTISDQEAERMLGRWKR